MQTQYLPYRRSTLELYDPFVHGFSNRFAWRCATKDLEALYRTHLTANHLDVGPGTGFFLDRVSPPGERPRIALLDFQAGCLTKACSRLERFAPETIVQDVLAPIALGGQRPFDSISMTYVMHCVRGDGRTKGRVFGHLRDILNPGGVLFGATVLTGDVPRNLIARTLSSAYNRLGWWANHGDTARWLEDAVRDAFPTAKVWTQGCVGLFVAHR